MFIINQYSKPLVKVVLFISIFYASCKNDTGSKKGRTKGEMEVVFYNKIGVGPIESILLSDSIDSEMVRNGESVFIAKCLLCHEASGDRKIGPGMAGVTKRRRPEWILNQILNPLEMSQKDSLSKELLLIYQSQMLDMKLTKEEARSVLEYFRKQDLE